ncbi:hypothetical protein Tco_1364242, partial [Tanacetum coccineum]
EFYKRNREQKASLGYVFEQTQSTEVSTEAVSSSQGVVEPHGSVGRAIAQWNSVMGLISMSKYAARILLSENNSYKDEFQKEVDKVRSIHKNRRRELIEEAVMRRPAKVDEYFGY